METFIGYPMRIATASLVRDGLTLFGITPIGVDAILILENSIAQIDLPCSGVKSLWTGALFLIVGIIYERRHTREIAQFSGISNVMPMFATVFLIMTMSSIGLPLLNGFIGEFTIMQGAFQRNLWWAVAGGAGIVLGAAYMLWLYQRTMFGSVTDPANEKLRDLNPREFATLVPLVALCFWIGVYPKPFLNYLRVPVEQIVQRVNPEYYNSQRAKLPVTLPTPAVEATAAPSEAQPK